MKPVPASRRIKKILDLGATRRVAYDLISRKAWTRQELTLRLRKRGAPTEYVEAVMGNLARQGYVDDEAYAQAWAEGRARQRHMGSHRIRQELTRKGVAKPLVDAAISKAFGPEGETGEALLAAKKRWPALELRDPEKAPRRLRDYLLRRGFSPEIVEEIVTRFTQQ